MRSAQTCLDTSVVVAAFATWHERHREARRILAAGPQVAAHSLVETYSVLTRLPAPHRAPAPVVAEFLAAHFVAAPLTLAGSAHLRLLQRLSERRVVGGAVHDALIAAVCATHDHTLVTFDRRASVTYQLVGCPFRLL